MAWPPDETPRWDLAGREHFDDRYGYRLGPAAGTWFIRGATADRRRFEVDRPGAARKVVRRPG
ncbi:hypothetical protein [Actinoplanes sp. NPDC026623]|uniref:hypothetical protein n=1 Tax=Actinoplanes sp. NPDC026623 TaxID=3155610 RepID=UPI003403ADE7